MEKIQDFLKSLTDRFNNPFIFSFICSWLIVNWRVTIGVLFYNAQTLNKVGYDSYLTLIRCEATEWNYLWFPFFMALAYTFGFPLVKIATASIQTFADKWTTKATLWISKGTPVPIDEYRKLTKDIEADKAELGRLISENRINEEKAKQLTSDVERIALENEGFLKELDSYRKELNTMQNEFDKIERWNSLDFISGLWQFREGQDRKDIKIENGTWKWIYKNGAASKEAYKVQIFSNPNEKTIILILMAEFANDNVILIHNLKITKEYDKLYEASGYDSKDNNIHYQRIA